MSKLFLREADGLLDGGSLSILCEIDSEITSLTLHHSTDQDKNKIPEIWMGKALYDTETKLEADSNQAIVYCKLLEQACRKSIGDSIVSKYISTPQDKPDFDGEFKWLIAVLFLKNLKGLSELS